MNFHLCVQLFRELISEELLLLEIIEIFRTKDHWRKRKRMNIFDRIMWNHLSLVFCLCRLWNNFYGFKSVRWACVLIHARFIPSYVILHFKYYTRNEQTFLNAQRRIAATRHEIPLINVSCVLKTIEMKNWLKQKNCFVSFFLQPLLLLTALPNECHFSSTVGIRICT